jgi:hypothetical protein
MKPYKPTQQEVDALYKHLENYSYDLYTLNHEFNFSLNNYDEALQRRDKDWQEKCIDDMDMINQRIEAIYKAANLIATAYKKTECLF